MCEWLSGGEWCDVQILCGGRYFNAHRAVLASVSNFLRRILMSCPSDETTIVIVLPDFDIEAMSSVLYYIYKGEVIVQKNKIGLFLDIIQAMQIYIDSQYLAEIREDVEKYEQEKYCERDMHNEIFTLGYSNNNNQNIYKIKKCEQSQRVVLKYSQSDSDFHDNSVRSQNESELGESRLGNLKLPYDGRQRSSLLRDLFIETYPQNGNVNGLTESVQAMSNRCYQTPASALLPNANCRHLSIDDALLIPSKITSHSSHPSAVIYVNAPQSALSFKKVYDRGSRDNQCSQTCKCSKFKGNPALIYGNSKEFSDNTLFSPHVNEKILELHKKKDVNPSFNTGKFGLHSKGYSQNMNTGKAILNHVLESPWNARKPNNYRPFRKKEKLGDGLPTTTRKEAVNAKENDTNNNIEKPLVQEEKVMESREQEIEELIHSSPIENRESFKCTHCDQVFTSAEALAVHMRRHSSNARYTCDECGKTFSQLRNFKYHMSIHRGTREFAATCSVCGKYFNDRGYLSSHMKIHRNRKEYKCSLCPKSFNQRVAYNMHGRIHTGVKPHVCEECGKAFSRKMLLKQHQRTHSGERPYACPHCDKRFADRSNMTLHLRLHSGVKPFSCPMCPKSFTKKHHLKSHLNFHTGSKPYSCPRCKLAFTQSSNMRTHYKKCIAPVPSTSNENSTVL